MPQVICTKCLRVDDEADPAVCGMAPLPCPPKVLFDPAKHVLTYCAPCDRLRALSIPDAMTGHMPSLAKPQCTVSPCQCLLAATPAPNPNPIAALGQSSGIDQAAKPKAGKATSSKPAAR